MWFLKTWRDKMARFLGKEFYAPGPTTEKSHSPSYVMQPSQLQNHMGNHSQWVVQEQTDPSVPGSKCKLQMKVEANTFQGFKKTNSANVKSNCQSCALKLDKLTSNWHCWVFLKPSTVSALAYIDTFTVSRCLFA